MPVSETSRTRMSSSPSRNGLPVREVVVEKTDTVIGEDADTGETKRIDLSALNEETPVVKAIAKSHRPGEIIPIKRGNQLLWRFVFHKVERAAEKG